MIIKFIDNRVSMSNNNLITEEEYLALSNKEGYRPLFCSLCKNSITDQGKGYYYHITDEKKIVRYCGCDFL